MENAGEQFVLFSPQISAVFRQIDLLIPADDAPDRGQAVEPLQACQKFVVSAFRFHGIQALWLPLLVAAQGYSGNP